ncbi:hypothetical protein GDO81_000179 [Engystomops pustulosus]|uniref:Uncharacterized protein n=1 Tax=Engystomops pustulosus TaxID=76066 RepID=A0AAV7D2N9_ENGPU|nr:hypothetical protein GDO81_000179 [Engystomops pustulosus]
MLLHTDMISGLHYATFSQSRNSLNHCSIRVCHNHNKNRSRALTILLNTCKKFPVAEVSIYISQREASTAPAEYH